MTVGAFNNRTPGFALLGLMLLLTGAAVGGVVVMSDYRQRRLEETRVLEEARIAELAEGFVLAVGVQLRIPGPSDWVGVVADATGRSPALVEYVDPSASQRSTLRRILVVDRIIGQGGLPFTQSNGGLTSGQNPFLSDRARVMIVSCSRMGLALPVQAGVLDNSVFDALWNWSYDPTTSAPPAGWPAAWSGMGAHLHVARIPLRTLFAPVGFKNITFGSGKRIRQGRFIFALRTILTRSTRYFLKGSLLKVNDSNGNSHRIHVVHESAQFDLSALLEEILDNNDDDWEWYRDIRDGRIRWRWRGWRRDWHGRGNDDDHWDWNCDNDD